MTMDEIRKSNRTTLMPEDVAEVIHVNPQNIHGTDAMRMEAYICLNARRKPQACDETARRMSRNG